VKQILALVLGVAIMAAGSSGWAHGPLDLGQHANEAYRAGDYVRAARLYSELGQNGWGDANTYFNAACSFALAGDADSAFVRLTQAVELGYADTEQLSSDTDLEGLRDDARWADVASGCSANAEQHGRLWDNPVWDTGYREDIPVAEKVAGLSRLWSGAKYGFANFDLVPDLDWDRSYFEYLDRVLSAGSTLEYYRLLQLMCVQLHDGHTYVSPPRELRNRFWSLPPLRTRRVENRVVVIEVYGDTAERLGVHPGDEVIEVDGIPVLEYARQYVSPYQFASTPQDLDTKTYETRLLAGAEGRSVTLLLSRPDGSRYESSLERLWGASLKEIVPARPPLSHWRVGKSEEIAYVALNTFNTPETADRFEELFDELSQASAMIIDIRENGGGNSGVGWRVLRLLTSESFLSSTWFTREYRPAFRAWKRPEGRYVRPAGVHAPDGERVFNGPVVVLTSPRTYSAAEDFCVSFLSMKRGIVMGEPTGGSTGQPLRLQLPGGITAAVCSKRDRFPDGTDFVGVGIQPDVHVAPTLADIRAGRDTVLEAAIAELEPEPAE